MLRKVSVQASLPRSIVRANSKASIGPGQWGRRSRQEKLKEDVLRSTRRSCQRRARGERSSVGCHGVQIDRSAHRLIAGRVRMKVIPLIVLGQRIAGLLRIDDDLIKVDDAVEGAAANEVVQRHADLLFLGRVVALERSARERIAE